MNNRMASGNGKGEGLETTAPVAMPTPEERVQACLAEVNASLERWGCRMQTVFTVVDGMPQAPQINVVVR